MGCCLSRNDASPKATATNTTEALPAKPINISRLGPAQSAVQTTSTPPRALGTSHIDNQPAAAALPSSPEPASITMPPSSTVQKNAIAEFQSLTKADKSTATRYLKNNNYNVQNAINAYYNDGPSLPSSGARNDLTKLFDKYRDDPKDSPNIIGMAGVEKYCGDIGVSVEDISFFVLSEIVQSPAMGEIEREKFVDGWALLNASDASRQKSAITARKAQLPSTASRDILKRTYKHAFKMFIQPPKRTLDVETAIALWTPFFSPQGLHWQTGNMDWFALWTNFMMNVNKRPVNKDVWDQTFVFAEKTLETGDVSFWNEDGAWPGVIDEFVEWVNKKGDAMEIE